MLVAVTNSQQTPGYRASSGEKKVVAVAQAAGIPDVLDRLVELKTQSEDPYSLRRLAAEFNTQLVTAAFSRHGADISMETAQSVYDVLTSDDVSLSQQRTVRSKLETHGVDEDRLVNGFVSHHAIQTYLSDIDEVDLSQSDESQSQSDRRQNFRDRFEKLTSRVSMVTKGTFETAVNTGLMPYETVPTNIRVTIRADCPDCGRARSASQLLLGDCQCQDLPAEQTD